MLRIGSLTLPTPALLAPMSGITDRPFRRLIRRCNPGDVGLYTTEFISAQALWHRSDRSIQMMRSDEDERPFAVQLFGRELAPMLRAGQMAVEHGAQLVDINCGCPAPKVVKRGGGASLMREPDHLAKLVETMVEGLPVPVTVKLRSGWDEQSINAIEVGRMAQEAGAAAVALHPRSRQRLYSGEADWGLVSELRKALSVPVIGSGDIVEPADVDRLTEGGLYMIGRGALNNPFIFRELAAARRGEQLAEASRPERLALLEAYAELLAEDLPDRAHLGRLKNLSNRMTMNWGVDGLRRKLLRAESVAQLLDAVRTAVDERSAA